MLPFEAWKELWELKAPRVFPFSLQLEDLKDAGMMKVGSFHQLQIHPFQEVLFFLAV